MFVVITCPRWILNLPPLILFGCQNLNIFGDPFLGTGIFSPSSGPLYTLKNFFPSLKNVSHHKTFFSLKIFYTIKNFCVTFHILWRWNFATGVESPLLAKCYATDGPNQKVTNVCETVLTIMTGFIMMLKMIRCNALTVPTHLDTVHTTLSTER